MCSVSTCEQMVCVLPSEAEQPTKVNCRGPVSARLQNSAAVSDLDTVLKHLLPFQRDDVKALVQSHVSLFRDRPGLTSMIIHDVETGDAPAIKKHPLRFSWMHPAKRALVREVTVYDEHWFC